MTQTAVPTTWGPTVRGGRRRRWWLRALLAVVVLLMGVTATGAALLLRASGRIERIEVAGLADAPGPMHVLVVGSDSREDLTEQERVELTAGFVAGERTDTIFVMTVGGGRVALLAFPRDLWVTRCDGSEGRINAAVGIGGPGCLVQTVSALSGLAIRHYLEVDFAGFRDIVDAVGGVEICLERPITDPYAGVDLPAGCHLLDGRTALGYVRVRRIDSDLGRIERQQRFLRALAARLVTPRNVLDPRRAFGLSSAVAGALTADRGLGAWDLLRLGLGVRGLASGAVTTHTVPVVPANKRGAAVLLPAEPDASTLFARFRDGSILEEATPGLDPADVEVVVLNGAGVEGLAARTRVRLTEIGFVVLAIGDAPAPVERTEVRYPPAAAEAAEVLARALPVSARLVPDPDAAGVTLVAGPDLVDWAGG